MLRDNGSHHPAVNALRLLGYLSLCLAFLLSAETSAYGWKNGGNHGDGFGTHDWALYEANRLARIQGDGWIETQAALAATDDPDTVLFDFNHHYYDIWGISTFGDAPDRIAELYRQAVQQRSTGDITGASITVGLLSHYYADICNPVHTDQCACGEGMHNNYEDAVQIRTDTPGEHRGWIAGDGTDYVADITAYAQSTASATHRSYSPLVGHYNVFGFDAAVGDITEAGLDRAANGLADILASINAEAGVHRLVTTTATIVPPPTTDIRYGGHASLSGSLSSEGGPVGHQRLRLQTKPAGRPWKTAVTVQTKTGGSWSYSAEPSRNTYYRVQYPGDTTYLHSISSSVYIRVKTKVSISRSASMVRVGGSARFRAAVSPNHAGRSVWIQKKVGTGWTTVAAPRLNRYSRAAWIWRPRRSGTYIFRAALPGHADHLTGVSPGVKSVVLRKAANLSQNRF